MTTTTPDLIKGQTATVIRPTVARTMSGYYSLNLTPADQGIVTRVFTNTVMVSFPRETIVGFPDGLQPSQYAPRYTVTLPKNEVRGGPVSPEALAEAAKPKRKLGEKPEGDEFIDPTHPGLQWLWDDVAKYATSSSYCYQYDSIAEKFGIPGRLRDFTASTTINGLTVSADVKARSQKEADQIVADKLAPKAKTGTTDA